MDAASPIVAGEEVHLFLRKLPQGPRPLSSEAFLDGMISLGPMVVGLSQ